MEYLRDGSGNEGEGGTAFDEGKSFDEERGSPITKKAGSRVIQRQGKVDFKGLVKNWCKWVRKMKISQNPCVRLTSEQFSYLDQVTSYPGI